MGFVVPLTRQQISDVYASGERATIRLIEDLYSTIVDFENNYNRYLQQQSETVHATNVRLNVQISKLKERNHELFRLNYELKQRIVALESANIERDSHNSHRPPSTDPLPRKRVPKSLRQPSGKAPGGQKGHPGHTRPLSEKPDKVITHAPPECQDCGASLADAYIVGCDNRQVIDLPPVVPVVVEHRSLKKRCATCGGVTKGKFPKPIKAAVQYGAGVRACGVYLTKYQLLPYRRAAELLAEVCGCPISPGTLRNMVRESAARLLLPEIEIKSQLKRSDVIHADETGLRVAGKGQYVHVASTEKWTHYGLDERRGKEAMDEIGILPALKGTCVHDGWFSYSYYYQCRHALCGAHLLRDLIYIEESNPHQKGVWAEPMRKLLLDIKERVDQARGEGSLQLDEAVLTTYFGQYDDLVRRGIELNPPRTKQQQATQKISGVGKKSQGSEKETRGRVAQTEARQLIARLEKYRAEVLRFMTDFSVPFDNNQAERDLRMVKLAQKTSGCFRTRQGAREFCRIRSVISTGRKQQQAILALLKRTADGRLINFVGHSANA